MFNASGDAAGLSLTSVPAFLTKLWTLVDDPSTDELICWDPSGKSFHVLDQARFAKEILPLYFKHNNIASFIRQLNMYGFRKIISTEAVNVKLEKDDMEFAHPHFLKDQEQLLEFIKRKVSTAKVVSMSNASVDDVVSKPDDVRHVLSEVNAVKGRQESLTTKLDNLKLENDVLWREVANLRQMHMKQQQVVNKLIQFLVTLVGNKRPLVAGVKRKGPLMLGTSAVPSKISRDMSSSSRSEKAYQVQSPQSSPVPKTSHQSVGVVIDDVTDYLTETIPLVEPVSLSAADADGGGVFADILDPELGAAAVLGETLEPLAVLGETLEPLAVLGETLEPLAVLGAGLPPTLELTDVLDDAGVVSTLVTEEVLSPSNNLIGETLARVPTTSLNSTRTIAVTDILKPQRNEIASQLDLTATQLVGLRELLSSSPQLSIDSNLVMDLFNFNMDTMPMCVEDFRCDEEEWKRTIESSLYNAQGKSENGGSIVGNELMQYTAPEDLSTMYFNDEDTSYQYLSEVSDFNDSVSGNANVGDINTEYLLTPQPFLFERRLDSSDVEDVMQDVD